MSISIEFNDNEIVLALTLFKRIQVEYPNAKVDSLVFKLQDGYVQMLGHPEPSVES